MKKFIYTGCSFTYYGFPTWGDIIAYDKIQRGEIDVAYNLALGGACNYYIMSSLLMAKSALNITSDDMVGVGWSTIWRHSLIDPESAHWVTLGSLYHNWAWNQLPNHLDVVNNEHYLMQRTATAYNIVHEIFDVDIEHKIGLIDGDIDPDELFTNIGDNANLTLTEYITKTVDSFLKIPDMEYPPHNEFTQELFYLHPSLGDQLLIAKNRTELLESTQKLFTGWHQDMMSRVDDLRLQGNDVDTIRDKIFYEIEISVDGQNIYGDPKIWQMIHKFSESHKSGQRFFELGR